jgi:hypothetical protein
MARPATIPSRGVNTVIGDRPGKAWCRHPSRLSRLATVSDGFCIAGMSAVLAGVWPVVDMGIAFGRRQAVRRRPARWAPRWVPTAAERSSSPGGCRDGGQRDRHPPFPRQGTSGTPWRSRRCGRAAESIARYPPPRSPRLTTNSDSPRRGAAAVLLLSTTARRCGDGGAGHMCDSNRNAPTGRKCYAAAREGNRIWRRNQQKTAVIGIV